jgi:hypothetical protein
VVELAVLTRAPRAELEAIIAPSSRAKLVRGDLCGDKAACDAVRAFAQSPAKLDLRIESASDLGVPKGEALAYVAKTLSREQRDAIPSLTSALVVTAHGAPLPSHLPARAGFAVTAAIASRLNALVYDEALRRIESHGELASHAITSPLDAPVFREDRIVIQLYEQDDGTARLLTLGMRRFGAPDVEIEGATMNAGTPLGRALNAVAERLVAGASEGPLLLGGSERTQVGFATSPHHEGDPDNTFLRVIARGGATAQAYDDLVAALYGKPDDALAIAAADDRALAAVAERARGAFPGAVERWTRWNEADRPDVAPKVAPKVETEKRAVLMVKLPFAFGDAGGDAGVEGMWIEVTRVTDSEIIGTLANRPVYVASVKSGDTVHGKRAELLDYLLTPGQRDGREGERKAEGGESMRLLGGRTR